MTSYSATLLIHGDDILDESLANKTFLGCKVKLAAKHQVFVDGTDLIVMQGSLVLNIITRPKETSVSLRCCLGIMVYEILFVLTFSRWGIFLVEKEVIKWGERAFR